MRKLLCISLILFSFLRVQAQEQEDIDSLMKVLPTLSETDTHMVRVLNMLAWDVSYHDLDSGLKIVNRAIRLAKEQGYAEGEANAQNVAGTIYADLGMYPEAINAHLQSIRIKDSLKAEPHELGGSYHNLALVYESMDSLNVSIRYQRLAYECYHRGTDSSGIAPTANVLGRHCIEVDSIDRAMQFFQEGRRVAESYHFKHWLAANMAGIAYCLAVDGKNAEADSLINDAFRVAQSEDNLYDMMSMYMWIAKLRDLQKQYQEAIAAVYSSLAISSKLNVRDSRMLQLKMLAELYEKSGSTALALKYYQQYQGLKDSILTVKNQRTIENLETVFETEKTEKELAIARESDQQQRIYVTGGIVCSLGFIAFAVLLFGRIKMGKKAGLILEQQKSIIESKNKDITDSINYARRIQEAVSPTESQLRSVFTDAFVFNRPRAIVSGDFWWIAETDDSYFLALGDCSGHGVPGGFMSVMAASFLNGIVIENKVYSPEKILFELNNKVRAALQHEGVGESSPLVSDTIELAVCRFSKKKDLIQFSLAGMPLIMIRESKMIEYRGSEFRAGAVTTAQNPFQETAVKLDKGDQIFLFSDGLLSLPGVDQKHMQDMLVSLDAQGSSAEKTLKDFVREHCGSLEQPDDILMIGVKV